MKDLNEQVMAKAVENMTNNLSVLRTMLHLSQADLAKLLGMGRQSVVAIETKKRKLTWNTFLSLLFIFTQNKETSALLTILEIYTPELKEIYSDINS